MVGLGVPEIMILVNIALAIWTFFNAKKKSKNAFLWFFVVLIFSIIGFIVYILYPKKSIKP